ncbi:MAG TPA: DUF423 domain-containing protein [Polyangiaceae bacterium]|jgi:uncharacterized membrane protein YgdD (TMEM256/DUF423 family)
MGRKPNFVAAGALLAAVGVGLGAFGAHGLRNVVSPDALAIWQTATLYWLFGALGTLAYGLWRREQLSTTWPGYLLAGGTLLFGGSLCGIVLGAPRALGLLTPIGGVGLILGFLLFALQAGRQTEKR